VPKLLIFLYSWVLEGRFSGVKMRFLPDGKEMPTGSASARQHLALLRRQPAIDDEPGPGHEGGIVGGEKDNAFGDVVGRAEPADRVARRREPARRVGIVGPRLRARLTKVWSPTSVWVTPREAGKWVWGAVL
jgi:hypothetical protein